MGTSFPPTDKTRLRRRPQRGSYDAETIFRILDSAVICHVGYVIDGEPYVTPTAYWREGNRLYWHGSVESRMLQAQATGLRVCVTVSHLDGFVVGRSGFAHSLLYRSVMAFGHTSMVNDLEEKRRAMHTFIDRLYPGRSRELRPLHDEELEATSLMSMTIEEASAKIRDGGVISKAEDYAFPCWAGVIPLRVTIGDMIPDPPLSPESPTPANLAAYAEHAGLADVLLMLANRPVK